MGRRERGGTHDQVPRRGDDDQVQREPVLGALQHPKRLSKAQVPQDIHSQVATPVAHVLRSAPPLLLRHDPGTPPYILRHPSRSVVRPRPDDLAKGPRVGEHVPLHLLDGIVGEGLRQHAPLPPVQLPVPRVVRVGRGVHEGVVEVRLADVGAVGVDCAEGGGGVEGEGVGPEADDGAFASRVLARTILYSRQTECPWGGVGGRGGPLPYCWCSRQNSRCRSPL